jgi:hypothetical protein
MVGLASTYEKFEKKIIAGLSDMFFMTSFSSDYIDINAREKSNTASLIVIDRLLYQIVLRIDHKRPHRTALLCPSIGFTQHAISRLIRRSKPEEIITLLSMATNICQIALVDFGIDKLFKDEDDRYWFPVSGIGYFLIAPNETGEGYAVVTFIDSTMLSESQKEAADKVDAIFRMKYDEWDSFKDYNDKLLADVINKPKFIFRGQSFKRDPREKKSR